MKKFIKLLLAGLLSISLIGCSSGSSDEDTGNDNTSGDIITTCSGNVLVVNNEDITGFAFNTEILRADIRTITFLNNLNDMPSEAWDVSENGDESVMAWAEKNENEYDLYYDLYIAGEGGVDANPSSDYLFCFFANLIEINFNDCFCTSNVTTMEKMFEQCESLSILDLRSFDTSNVTNMHGMFFNCYDLISLDLSNFNTSKVTDMSYMFYWCESLTDLDLSSFDTSNVENDDYMFDNCPAGDNY